MTRRPIDLARVRQARRDLDAAVARWPHLRGPEAAARLARWMDTGGPDTAPDEQEGNDMATLESLLQLRVPEDWAGRMDRVAAAMQDTPFALAVGRVTRSMVARLALAEGLAVLEARHGVSADPARHTESIQDKTPSIAAVRQGKTGPGEGPEPEAAPVPPPVSDRRMTGVVAATTVDVTPVATPTTAPLPESGPTKTQRKGKRAAPPEAPSDPVPASRVATKPSKPKGPPAPVDVPLEAVTPKAAPEPTRKVAKPATPEAAATPGAFKVVYQVTGKDGSSKTIRTAKHDTAEARAEWLAKAERHPRWDGVISMDPPKGNTPPLHHAPERATAPVDPQG